MRGTLKGILGSLCSRPRASHAPLREGCQAQPGGARTLDAGCGLNIGNRRGHGRARPRTAHGGQGGEDSGTEVSARPGDREPLGEKEPGTKEAQRG